jgi:hypothetical protein
MATNILTPPEFVAKWQRVRQTERATAQQHFLDICHLLERRSSSANVCGQGGVIAEKNAGAARAKRQD